MFNDVIPLNIKVAGQASFVHLPGHELDPEAYADDRLNVYVDHAFRHYKQVLLNTPDVWRWFAERKILLTHELIETFSLGFADRTLCKDYRREKGRRSEIVRGAWQVLGLLKPSGHQYFHGDVVVPIYDDQAHIVGAYGRRVSPEQRPGHVYHHHWYNGDATFFNRSALSPCDRVILCKSPIEALTLLSAGFTNVIATMGIFSFGHHHLAELDRIRPTEVVLAFDNSDTGNHVAGMVAQALDAYEIPCLRLPLPRNKDINAFVHGYDDHVPELERIIDAAFPYQQTYENLVRR